MPIELDGQTKLGADAVRARHHDGVAVAIDGQLEQAAEAADAAEDPGAVRARDERSDALDELGAGGDVHAGVGVRERVRADAVCHGGDGSFGRGGDTGGPVGAGHAPSAPERRSARRTAGRTGGVRSSARVALPRSGLHNARMIRLPTLVAVLTLWAALPSGPRVALAQADPARTDPARTEPARTEPGRIDPARGVSADPWSREVAVADRGPEERRAAQSLAMREVLLANSGDKTLLNRDDVRAGLADAERYVERFEYRTPPPGTIIPTGTPLTDAVRESGEATQLMRVAFDRGLLGTLIAARRRRGARRGRGRARGATRSSPSTPR